MKKRKHYYKHLINDLRDYTGAWINTVNKSIDDVDELIKENKSLQQPAIKEEANNYKLKTNLNLSQVAFLFQAIFDDNLISDSNKKNLARFIAFNVSVNDKVENKEINIEHRIEYIYNSFSSPNKNTIDYWDEKFLHFRQYTQNLLKSF